MGRQGGASADWPATLHPPEPEVGPAGRTRGVHRVDQWANGSMAGSGAKETGSMGFMTWKRDDRTARPERRDSRQDVFRAGWPDAVDGIGLRRKRLRRLTWRNLGWRMGRLFGGVDPEFVDRLFGAL